MNNIQPIDHKFNLPASSAMTAIIPRNMDEVWRLAQAVSLSGLAPTDMKEPEKVTVAILHGMEIGLKPMQAIQRIAVINGRPSLWGDAALGLVRASGLLEYIKETFTGEGDARTAVCETKRRGDPEPIIRSFSVHDARVAKLWGKTGSTGKPTPWVTHPERMLQMRARGFNLRDAFPDVLGGMYLAEELQDETIDVTPAIPTPPTPPTPPASAVRKQLEASVALIEEKNVGFNFEAYRKSLQDCATIGEMNAIFDNVMDKVGLSEDEKEECQRILSEIAAPLWKSDDD